MVLTVRILNSVMILQELTFQKKFETPKYQIVSSVSGTHNNRFDYRVEVAGISAKGSGRSKQIGKHQAAENALKILNELGIYNPTENPVTQYSSPMNDEITLQNGLTYIIKLQATCSKNKIPLPEFREVSNEGPPHGKRFTMECRIYLYVTQATANKKRMGKQLAAKQMLERIEEVITKYNMKKDIHPTKSFKNNIDNNKSDRIMPPVTKTPVMVLQELTVQKGLDPPNFQIVFSKSGTHENRFDYEVSVAGITAVGSGPSKQIGKHEAAHNALKILEEIGIYIPAENPVAEFRPSLKDGSPLKSALNSIVELQNICLENKIPAPDFTEISSIGPPHAKEFTLECKISSIVTEATANTKKMAKQLAAREMLNKIKNIMPDIIIESNMNTKKLMEKHDEVISQYNFLTNIIPDKGILVNDMPHTLKKLMVLKNFEYEDLKEDLETCCEENLKKILEKLEVEYELLTFQEKPLIVGLVLKIDTPFVILDMGENLEIAKKKTLEQAFEKMKFILQLKVDT